MLIRLFIYIFCFSFSLFAFALPSNSIYNLNSNLTDYNGNVLNIKDLSGKIQIFSMIYTKCKTVCPIIISNMKSVEKLIPEHLLDHVSFSLISLDPDRDSVDVLHNFFIDKKFESNRWNLYKTDKNTTLKIALISGIKYKKEKNDEYTHSNLILVLDKEGVIRLHHPGLDKNYSDIIDLIVLLTSGY